QATGDQPVLGLHWTMVSPGGGGHALQPGHLVVINVPQTSLGGTLSIVDGRLHLDSGRGPVQLTGADYLVIRVECRSERDDWRFPELDALIRQAGSAAIEGNEAGFKARR